jgi:hypothetical protein
MQVRRASYAVISALGIVFLSACTSSSEPAASADTFQLVIFEQDWMSLGLRYDYEQAWPRLLALDRTNALFTVSAAEIEVYDWAHQSITLTAEATAGLVDALAQAGALNEGATALKDLEASLGWGNPVEQALYTRGFVVTLNDEPLYGGIFLNAISQMAIDYPVIRVEVAEGKAILRLLPTHLAFLTTDPVAAGNTAEDPQIAPEAQGDWNQFPQEFRSAFLDAAESDRATTFRALIQDARIRTTMEQAGKLQE